MAKFRDNIQNQNNSNKNAANQRIYNLIKLPQKQTAQKGTIAFEMLI